MLFSCCHFYDQSVLKMKATFSVFLVVLASWYCYVEDINFPWLKGLFGYNTNLFHFKKYFFPSLLFLKGIFKYHFISVSKIYYLLIIYRHKVLMTLNDDFKYSGTFKIPCLEKKKIQNSNSVYVI